MNVPFLSFKDSYSELASDIDQAIKSVLVSGSYILGDKVEQFEEAWAHYCTAKYAVGVSNGLDALTLALKAVGIEPGDEVTRKLWKSPHHHFARVGGLWLVLLGYVGLIGYTIVEMLSADGLAFPNLCFIGILIGTAILLLSFIRERIAKHAADPYKDIQR